VAGLVDGGARVYEVRVHRPSLEEIFLDVVEGEA
jgi:hypothetical protein